MTPAERIGAARRDLEEAQALVRLAPRYPTIRIQGEDGEWIDVDSMERARAYLRRAIKASIEALEGM